MIDVMHVSLVYFELYILWVWYFQYVRRLFEGGDSKTKPRMYMADYLKAATINFEGGI